MRLIVVDVGNTSTAVALWVNGRITKVAHCDAGVKDPFEIVSSYRTHGDEALAYVSVVPSKDKLWHSYAKRNKMRFHQVSYTDFPQEGNGIHRIILDYPKVETIGADRLADAVGAVDRYGSPLIVMDFGTALTAAAITSDCKWRGGVIAPGFPLMRDYLFERTAKLPRMELGRGTVPKIGRSTEEAMRFGALVGYRGMVREIVTTLRKNYSEDFRVVATGGFARWALKNFDMQITIDPTLTLYGAGLICSKYL